MNSLVLRTLNPVILLFCFTLILAAQTTVFSFSWLSYFQPNLALGVIIWLTFKRNFTEGGVLTLLIGEICEIHSSSPQGFYLTTYMAVYLGLRLADKYLVLPQYQGGTILTAIVAALYQVACLFIFHQLEVSSTPIIALAIRLPIFVGTTTLASYWVFKGLHRLDWVTLKDPRSRGSYEDEMSLEGEVF